MAFRHFGSVVPKTIAKRILNIEYMADRIDFIRGGSFDTLARFAGDPDTVFFIQFRADFEVFRQPCTTKGKQLMRYVLCSLERQHSQQDSWHATESTIEHILPDSLDEAWSETFSEEEHARYVDRLGNYALLEQGKNKDLGQKPFTVKKAIFGISQYGLTRDVAACDEWSKDNIAQRQRKLARLALTVWRLP